MDEFQLQMGGRRSVLIALLIGFSALGHADDPPQWNKDAASKEIDGMRRYTWVLTERITAGMRQSDKLQYPGVHAFLDQSAKSLADIDPNEDPSEWPELDLSKLITHNPKFWTAYYEVSPGDPLIMWLHACYYGINGHVHRALYAQSLALRSGTDGPIKNEMPRLVISANRVIGLCRQQVNEGIKHHDAQEYPQAEAIYRDVLEVCPTHSSALYELGYTLNNASRKAGKRDDSVSQPYYDRARKHDPFMASAYQGSFTPETFRQMGKLKSSAIPNWNAMMRTPPQRVELEKLESLSTSLQESGLHELALIARQTVVSRREGGYDESDRAFINRSLSKVLPDAEIPSITDLLTDDQQPRLSLKLPTKQD